jgi:hypothetical protein
MKLTVDFASKEAEEQFKDHTGETDLSNVHVGLLNHVLAHKELANVTYHGDPIACHVRHPTGTWEHQVLLDPVAAVRAGFVVEPDHEVKFLLADIEENTWAQNRIANRFQPLVGDPYMYDVTSQRPVEVIICDSGIHKDHIELKDAKIDDLFCIPSLNGDFGDDLGHGTALASIVVGKTLGLNKAATIKNVRISSGTKSATLSELAQAFDAIYDHHVQSPEIAKVLNLSWRIPRSQFIDQKIKRLIDAGMIVFAAAGNTSLCIDDITPAGTDRVLTIAASTKDDHQLVDVYGIKKQPFMFAPGEDIVVAGLASDTSYIFGDGSSISSVLASGVASIVFGMGDVAPSSDNVRDFMKHDATFNTMFLPAGSKNPNFMLHMPNAHARIKDVSIYINEFQIDQLKNEVVEIPLAYMLPYFNKLQNTVYTFELVFDSDENQQAFAPSVVNADGSVDIKLDSLYDFDKSEKYKLVKFKLLAKANHAVEESHWIMFSMLHDMSDVSTVQSDIYNRTDVNVNFLSATGTEKDV